jgi:hypothetical protein
MTRSRTFQALRQFTGVLARCAYRRSMLARSPNRKAAVAYLAASGAVRISIIEHDGVCRISTGRMSALEPTTDSPTQRNAERPR